MWNSHKKLEVINIDIETKAVHGGERSNKRQYRSVTTPIEQTAAYYFENTKQIQDFYIGKLPGIKYGRYGCPTQHAVEEKMSILENTERTLLFSSGMNAITTTILALVKNGEHIVFTDDCYRNTIRFFSEILPTFGISSTMVPLDDIQNLEKYLQKNTVVFFSELPTNPFLRVIDLKNTIEALQKRKITSVIDSTFATPINIKPAEYGVDLVIHSATKYLGGHHDLFAGTVSGKTQLVEKIQLYRDIFGGIIDPHTAYLLLRSLQTLSLRMDAHNRNGLQIAKYLENHPKIEKVWYPGCTSHPDYTIAEKQLSGFGGAITFTLKANEAQTSKFIDSLKIPYIATNLGGPQSLIEQHAILTFFKNRGEAKKRGITDNLIRYSTGFENVTDVIQDFEQAFKNI